MENTKLIELDPNKNYMMVVVKGKVDPKQLVLNDPAARRRTIPIVFVDSLDDLQAIETPHDHCYCKYHLGASYCCQCGDMGGNAVLC